MRRTRKPRSFRRILAGYVLAAVTVGAAVSAWTFHQPVWAALRTHPYFAIRDLRIRGAGPLLTRGDILAWLGLEEDAHIWDVFPPHVKGRLESHPLIARARVQREFPGSFEIEIRERRPTAIVLLDRLYYVGDRGHVLMPLEPEHDPDYPVITGLTKDTPAGYRTWVLRRALRLRRLCERMQCFEGLSEIHVDPELGMVVYPRHPEVPVVLGWGSWRDKLERAELALAQWSGRVAPLARLDTRFRNQIVVSFRDGATVGKSGKNPRRSGLKT